MTLETFTLLGWAWDIEVAEHLAQRHPVRPAVIRALTGVMGLIRIDRDHAMTVDLTKPLLVIPVPCAPEPGNRLVIDGWHRVYRAQAEGCDVLPAVFLDAEDERSCRLRGDCG